MGQVLTVNDILMCPHGGSVSLVSSQPKATAVSGLMLRSSDQFIIAGCPFLLGPVYHPCVSVQWMTTSLKCKAGGDFVVTDSCVGLCLAADQAPQGSVLIQKKQAKVSAL